MIFFVYLGIIKDGGDVLKFAGTSTFIFLLYSCFEISFAFGFH